MLYNSFILDLVFNLHHWYIQTISVIPLKNSANWAESKYFVLILHNLGSKSMSVANLNLMQLNWWRFFNGLEYTKFLDRKFVLEHKIPTEIIPNTETTTKTKAIGIKLPMKIVIWTDVLRLQLTVAVSVDNIEAVQPLQGPVEAVPDLARPHHLVLATIRVLTLVAGGLVQHHQVLGPGSRHRHHRDQGVHQQHHWRWHDWC